MNPSIESIVGHRLYIMYVERKWCVYKDDICVFSSDKRKDVVKKAQSVKKQMEKDRGSFH